jgi:hypothetical protein
MQSRREFLTQATVTLLLIPLASGACTNDYGTGNAGSGPGVANGSGCDGVPSTSSVVGGHSHTLCVAGLDLSNPRSGVTLTTSTVNNHTHVVALSQAQLSAIAAGNEVTVETTSKNGHAHTFMIVKLARPSPSPTPAQPPGPHF